MEQETKGKESTALAVEGTKKLESEIVLYSGSPEISKELEKAQTLSQKDFYKVAGKTVPSARALQWLANRKNIKTRVVDIQSTSDYCRATVGGWIGNNPIPEANQIYKEATVEMMFDVEMAEKMLDIIRKHNRDNPNNKLERGKDWDVDKDGRPYFINQKYQDKMMREMLRLRKFALRTVITKAERIIHSKLADVEWRDEDEMDDEKHEVELVSGKPINMTPPKASFQQCAQCGGAIPNNNESGLCVNCTAPDNEDRPSVPPVEDAEYEDVRDEPEPEEDGNTLQDAIEEILEDNHTVTLSLPADLIDDAMRPRDALKAIMGYATENGLGDIVRPVLISHYKKYDDLGRYAYHIPESKAIKIVEELTGIKTKKAEKVLTCKAKDCKAKITEAEAKEQGGNLCLACWTKEND